jgi:hypothetical protein
MSLEDPRTIDMMGISNGKVILDIVDPGNTMDENRRNDYLMQKLSTYLRFIMGSDFKKQFPVNRTTDTIIHVACRLEPTKEMKNMNFISPREDKSLKIPVIFEKYDLGDGMNCQRL